MCYFQFFLQKCASCPGVYFSTHIIPCLDPRKRDHGPIWKPCYYGGLFLTFKITEPRKKPFLGIENIWRIAKYALTHKNATTARFRSQGMKLMFPVMVNRLFKPFLCGQSAYTLLTRKEKNGCRVNLEGRKWDWFFHLWWNDYLKMDPMKYAAYINNLLT